MEHNHLPNTPHCFFENGETEYRYFSEESMDNNWSMDWFTVLSEKAKLIFWQNMFVQIFQLVNSVSMSKNKI
jgi:hypothetical protein